MQKSGLDNEFSESVEVSDLDHELSIHDLQVVTEPISPSGGTRVAMIEHNGAPFELIGFVKKI